MIPLGLSASRMGSLVRALSSAHTISVTAHLLDLQHTLVDDVTHMLMDGQVDGAQEQANPLRITRAAQVELLDPRHRVGFDTSNPVSGQVFVDRMLRVVYSVHDIVAGEWVDIPVFTGPVVHGRRTGPMMRVEAVSKDWLVDRPAWKVITYPKGTRKVDMIRDLLVKHTGESTRYLDIPEWGARLPSQQVLGRETSVWDRITKLAKSMDAQAFYDGRGVFRLRRVSNNVVFTFRDGSASTDTEPAFVLSEPQAQFEGGGTEIVNTVWVLGADLGKGKRVEATAYPPKDHPLSPWRMGRNGVPLHRVEKVEDEAIRSDAEAQTLADNIMASRLRSYVSVTLNSLAVPFLEISDMCGLHTRGTVVPTFRLPQFSLPLSHAGVMSVGTRRKVSLNRAAIRRRR